MLIPSPLAYRNLVGPANNYFIHEWYESRLDPGTHDDRQMTDEFQREVYEYAHMVVERDSLGSVCDVGCGSGFKLMAQFEDRLTLGIDLPETVEFLDKRYPGRQWKTFDLATGHVHAFDLIIAADVIEHLVEPDNLLRFISLSQPKRIIVSTPERDLLNHGTFDGPPHNFAHVREWNFTQFNVYIGHWFTIREHFVVNGTQVVEAECQS